MAKAEHYDVATGTEGVGAPTPEPEDDTKLVKYAQVAVPKDRVDALSRYLVEEIGRAEGLTAKFRERLRTWRDFLDARELTKSFPWEGASSIRVPLLRIVIDSLTSSAKRSIELPKKKWVAEIINPEYAGIEAGQEAALIKAAEDFSGQISDAGMLDLRGIIDGWFEEQYVSGFAALKLVREVEKREMVTSPNAEPKTIVIRDGLAVYVVPTETLCWPGGLFRTVHDMPWIGNWVEVTPAALRERARDRSYRFVNEVLKTGLQHGPADEGQQQRMEQAGVDPDYVVRLHEIHIRWDLFGNDVIHDLKVVINVESGLVHDISYNPLGDGMYPFEIGAATPRVGALPGRSLLEPNIQPCRAINTAVNQTFDAQTLANSPTIRYPENSPSAAILAGGFFPGMQLPYGTQADEISLLEFPPPSATSFQMVQFFISIVERLSHVGPSRLGDISEGKRTPASLGLSMQQIGNETIDEFVDRSRDILGRIWTRAMRVYVQVDPDIFERLCGPDGTLLRSAVERSIEQNRSMTETLRIRLYASSATRNKELDRQNRMQMAQVLMGWYPQATQAVQLALTPGLPPQGLEALRAVLKASQAVMRGLAELADHPDVDTVVPDVAALLPPMPIPAMPPTPGQPGAEGGGEGGPEQGGGGGAPPPQAGVPGSGAEGRDIAALGALFG